MIVTIAGLTERYVLSFRWVLKNIPVFRQKGVKMFPTRAMKKRRHLLGKNNCSVQREPEKLDFSKAVFIYMFGGLVGTLWETVLNLCLGRGFVFCNGSIFTPFNFVYGCGALFVIVCLHNRTSWQEVYWIGALGGGAVEYLLNFLEEKILGTRSWNYADKPLNLNGRTTLIYMAFWGLLCVVVIFAIYQPLNRQLSAIPPKTRKTIATVMSVVILLDMTVTVGALFRYTARNAGNAALTPMGELIDRLFDDAFMKRRFPSMKLA